MMQTQPLAPNSWPHPCPPCALNPLRAKEDLAPCPLEEYSGMRAHLRNAGAAPPSTPPKTRAPIKMTNKETELGQATTVRAMGQRLGLRLG